jgi:uncharacterized protein
MVAGGSLVYLASAGSAWIVAHACKYILTTRYQHTERSLRSVFASGGMPSAHSALMASIVTAIGIRDGVDSAIFALALTIAVIVMYDALMVRRAVGEQGGVIRRLLEKVVLEGGASVRAASGHTPLEVGAGASVGILVAIAVALFITK